MTEDLEQALEPRFVKQARDFNIRRVIVKIGSSLLTNNGRGLDRTAIYEWLPTFHKPTCSVGELYIAFCYFEFLLILLDNGKSSLFV